MPVTGVTVGRSETDHRKDETFMFHQMEGVQNMTGMNENTNGAC
jgi:hypothetical protein